MTDGVTLMLGDCLDRMREIADGSVDLVCADLPYGVTSCRWDVVIPFEPLWEHYKRVLKPRGAVVLTASQPFTSMLVMSNLKWFKYGSVWRKTRGGDHFNAKNKPLGYHEDIAIFSPGTTANRSPRRMTYNPQGVVPGGHGAKQVSYQSGGHFSRRPSHAAKYGGSQRNYPGSVLDFPSVPTVATIHPTQKPVDLFEYLLKTYSNPGDLVLDNSMGSGTTVLAAINTGRRVIGIERDPIIFATAEARVAAHQASTPLLKGVAS